MKEHPCATCKSCSQISFCHCALIKVKNQSALTLCTPPLLFRRRPPQSNYPPDAVPHPDNGRGLDSRHMQGGISTVTPPQLALKLPSLPPILHNMKQKPTSSYSKGPRGLSVLVQLTSIFTRTSISPSLWLRQ